MHRARLQRIPGEGLFAYVRHNKNQWSFRCGHHLSPPDWKQVPRPAWLPAEDLAFYERLAQIAFSPQ